MFLSLQWIDATLVGYRFRVSYLIHSVYGLLCTASVMHRGCSHPLTVQRKKDVFRRTSMARSSRHAAGCSSKDSVAHATHRNNNISFYPVRTLAVSRYRDITKTTTCHPLLVHRVQESHQLLRFGRVRSVQSALLPCSFLVARP